MSLVDENIDTMSIDSGDFGRPDWAGDHLPTKAWH